MAQSIYKADHLLQVSPDSVSHLKEDEISAELYWGLGRVLPTLLWRDI